MAEDDALGDLASTLRGPLAQREGTPRAEPLRDALARFERPATVISEAPDAASTRLIGDVLLARA